MNPVHSEPSPNLTGFKMDRVQIEPSQQGFTQVPNVILRQRGLFEDPIDFVVYLHMFTFSWGYHRDFTDMAVSQLERFSGVARNTIRRALVRLKERGWIAEYSGPEPGGVCRGWVVKHPDPTAKPERGSKLDRVQNEPRSKQTPRGSKLNPGRGSKMDPSKESIKQTPNKTLSLDSEKLREYFATVQVPRKRESEWRACQEILKAYSEADLEAALECVQVRGVGESGTKSHSPMAYLAVAMGDVIARQRAEIAATAERELRVRREQDHERARRVQEEREESEIQERLEAFRAAFPDPEERHHKVIELTKNTPALGERAREILAMSKWDYLGPKKADD